MLLQMGVPNVVGGHRRRTRYEKITNIDDGAKAARPRTRWMAKVNRKLKGFRLSRSRRLTWKAFSVVVSPRRLAEIYAEIVNRMKMVEASSPTIVFSAHWGLPVLSHSSVKCRSAISCHKNLAF